MGEVLRVNCLAMRFVNFEFIPSLLLQKTSKDLLRSAYFHQHFISTVICLRLSTSSYLKGSLLFYTFTHQISTHTHTHTPPLTNLHLSSSASRSSFGAGCCTSRLVRIRIKLFRERVCFRAAH